MQQYRRWSDEAAAGIDVREVEGAWSGPENIWRGVFVGRKRNTDESEQECMYECVCVCVYVCVYIQFLFS